MKIRILISVWLIAIVSIMASASKCDLYYDWSRLKAESSQYEIPFAKYKEICNDDILYNYTSKYYCVKKPELGEAIIYGISNDKETIFYLTYKRSVHIIYRECNELLLCDFEICDKCVNIYRFVEDEDGAFIDINTITL